MAKVYSGDYVRERSTGLPGIVTSLQSAHLNISFAGETGTRQLGYGDVELISEPDQATIDAINSTVSDQHPTNTISPVPRDMPTIGEVFPDLAADASLEAGVSTAIDAAHPDPAMVGTGLFEITGPDGRVLAYLRSVTRERNERAELARQVAAAREARDFADDEFGTDEEVTASTAMADLDRDHMETFGGPEAFHTDESPMSAEGKDEEARDNATADAPSTPLFGGDEAPGEHGETSITQVQDPEPAPAPEPESQPDQPSEQPQAAEEAPASEEPATAPTEGPGPQPAEQPQIVETPTEQAAVEPVAEQPAQEPLAPAEPEVLEPGEPVIDAVEELDEDEKAEVAEAAESIVEASQSSESTPAEDKVLTETAERLDEAKPEKPADYSELGFRDLQRLARERGLRSGGSAEVLRARLVEFDAKAASLVNAS